MYNPAYAQWKAEYLSLQLYPLRYEPIAGKEAHTQTVVDLINRVDVIIHAGDPDNEGQLLLRSCWNIPVTASQLSVC